MADDLKCRDVVDDCEWGELVESPEGVMSIS
jgi:hypothetical protein